MVSLGPLLAYQYILNSCHFSTADQVKSVWMQPFKPANYNGSLPTLMTIYNAYIPNKCVTTLAKLISSPNSLYFTGQSGVLGQLADFTVPNFPITYSQDPYPLASGAGSGNSHLNSTKKLNNERKIIIIAVCSVTGGITILAVVLWLRGIHKTRSAYRESIRRQLRDRYEGHGAFNNEESEESPSIVDVSPMPIGRRDSFYFAEESLRNYSREQRLIAAFQSGTLPFLTTTTEAGPSRLVGQHENPFRD
jgi:hypothetical protein